MIPRANNLPGVRPLAVRDEGSIPGRSGLKNRVSEQRDDFSVNRKPKGHVVQIPSPQPKETVTLLCGCFLFVCSLLFCYNGFNDIMLGRAQQLWNDWTHTLANIKKPAVL